MSHLSENEIVRIAKSLESSEQIVILRTKFPSSLTGDVFSQICVFTASFVYDKVEELPKLLGDPALAEEINSADFVEYFMMLDSLFDLDYSEEQIAQVRFFSDVIAYVGSALQERDR